MPDDELLLAWARLFRLLRDGGMHDQYEEIERSIRTRDALISAIDVDKALAGLLPLVKSDDKDQAMFARFAIQEITSKQQGHTLKLSPEIVAVLVKALGSEEYEVAGIASDLLGLMSPYLVNDALPAFMDALSNERQEVRSEAVGILKQVAIRSPLLAPPIIERLSDMLSDVPAVLVRERRNTNTHVDVAYALAAIGPAAAPPLLKALNETNSVIRHHAAIGLAKMGHDHGEKIIPILTEALASPYPATRWAVMNRFVNLAKQPTLVNQVLKSVVQVLEATEDTVGNRVARPDAAYTLGAIAVTIPTFQPEITEKLIGALNTPNFVCGYFGDFDTRGKLTNFHVKVANQLASIRTVAVPSLLNALNSTDADVQHHAAIALTWIDTEHGEKTIPILAEALASPHPETQAQAVRLLQKLGKKPVLADQITPILVKVLETSVDTEEIYNDLTLHELVASALAQINLPAITEKLQSEDPYIQRLAATAIAEVSNGGIDDPETNRRIIEILVPKERMEDIKGIQEWLRDWWKL